MSPILKNEGYKQCTRCLMDTSATGIYFDSAGICNYCSDYMFTYGSLVNESAAVKEEKLDRLVARVKSAGRGKRYDCIVGVSGGVDSSTVLVEVVKRGLRPLAVHMDNGWNSELAQNNIANLVRALDVDLHTHVIDWNEYRGLMQAFFDSNVIDIELLYDNAMLAVNYSLARKYGVRHILSGSNAVTEGMAMPSHWNWFKRDKKNIVGISKKFNGPPIKSFPAFGVLDHVYCEYIARIHWISFLDYISYNKEMALIDLENNFAYKRYPFKHYESIFTRFYQGYILPNKFGVDKRLLHLSTLVMSNQMCRQDAIKLLEGIPYASQQLLDEDILYFLKKMGWNQERLSEYMKQPTVAHDVYPTEKPLWDFLLKIRSIIPAGLVKWLKGGS